MIRAWANVSMLCTTIVKDHEKFADEASIPRENLICKINYVAQGMVSISVFFLLRFLPTYLYFSLLEFSISSESGWMGSG